MQQQIETRADLERHRERRAPLANAHSNAARTYLETREVRGAGESKDRANREGARMHNHRGNAAMWQQIEQRTDVKRHRNSPYIN